VQNTSMNSTKISFADTSESVKGPMPFSPRYFCTSGDSGGGRVNAGSELPGASPSASTIEPGPPSRMKNRPLRKSDCNNRFCFMQLSSLGPSCFTHRACCAEARGGRLPNAVPPQRIPSPGSFLHGPISREGFLDVYRYRQLCSKGKVRNAGEFFPTPQACSSQ